MIVYKKDGKDFLLLANNSRGVMKISTEGIDGPRPSPAPSRGRRACPYETIAD